MPTFGEPPPDPHAIRTGLDRIAASRPFDTSPQLTSFLRFVVEATLAGRGERLKGYTIGVEALGRGENFNPQIDPIGGSKPSGCGPRWRDIIPALAPGTRSSLRFRAATTFRISATGCGGAG